jgi:hypothetical protein
MKISVLWVITRYGSYKNLRFGGPFRLHVVSSQRSMLIVTADVPSWLILVTLMMEAILSSETSVLTRGTRCYIPKDGILRVLSCWRIDMSEVQVQSLGV